MDLQPVVDDTPRRRWSAFLSGAGVVLVAALAVAALYWHHEGVRWYAVTSPSMGEVMPTGSLIVTEPTTVAQVRVGDVVTFRSPGSRTVFSHRVVAITDEGLTTRGDVNLADDAWTIDDDDLIGTVTSQTPGVGWLLRGVPMLLLGFALTWLLARAVRRTRRSAVRLLGGSVTVAVVNVLLHPWVGLSQLAQTTPDDGSPGVLMQVVSTGLLPIRAFEVDGSAHLDLVNGEDGVMHLTQSQGGRYELAARLDLPWWGWALLVLVVLLPLAVSLLVRRPPIGHSTDVTPSVVVDAEGQMSLPAMSR